MEDNNVIVEVPFGDNDGNNIPESDRIKELTDKLEQTEKRLEELRSSDSRLMTEDMVIQENEWLQNRLEAQRLAENLQREELFEKQKLLDSRRKEQSESLAQAKQMQLYNKMHDEEQRDIVYALNGISVDKEEGMQEYGNALYQGAMIAIFLVNIALALYAAFIFGFASVEFLAFAALMAAQITLLPKERHGKIKNGIGSHIKKLLSFLPTITMALILVVEEKGLLPLNVVLFATGIGVLVLSALGAASYYIRNPYRLSRRSVHEARAEVKSLKKSAAKTVKKNHKFREKLEAKLVKDKDKQENRLKALREREELKYIKAKRREEEKAEKLKIKLEKEAEWRTKNKEISEIRESNRSKRKELVSQKIVDLFPFLYKDKQG